MQIKYLDQQPFMNDFLPLIAELECGRHYDPTNPQHVQWLQQRVAGLYILGGQAICLYSDQTEPIGLLFLMHDRGLEGVRCFGKMARIAMFGLFAEYRGQGLGGWLLQEAEQSVLCGGGECLYVDTYAANDGAIRYYVRRGFIPVSCHPGENGLDDKGQVYLYKELTSDERPAADANGGASH